MFLPERFEVTGGLSQKASQISLLYRLARGPSRNTIRRSVRGKRRELGRAALGLRAGAVSDTLVCMFGNFPSAPPGRQV